VGVVLEVEVVAVSEEEVGNLEHFIYLINHFHSDTF